MNKRLISIDKTEQIVFPFLVFLLFFMITGCNRGGSEAAPMVNPEIKKEAALEGKPSTTVEKFMEHVAKGEIEEAEKYTTVDYVRPAKTPTADNTNANSADSNVSGSGYGLPSKFNWALSLHNRNLQLENIFDEQIVEDRAKVGARLGDSTNSSISMDWTFYLKRESDEWLIYNLDLMKIEPNRTSSSPD